MSPQILVALTLLLIVSAVSQKIDTTNGAEDYLDESESVTDRDEVAPTTKTDDNTEGTPQTEIDNESHITITYENEETTTEAYSIPLPMKSRSRNKRRIHFGKIKKCWGSPVYLNKSKQIHMCNSIPTTKTVRKFLKMHTTDSSINEPSFKSRNEPSQDTQDIENLFDKFFKNILDVNVHESVKSTPLTYSENLPARDIFVHKFLPITDKPISLEDEILVNKTQQLFKEVYDYENELLTTKASFTASKKPVGAEIISMLDENVHRIGKTVDEKLANHLLDEITDSDNDFPEDASLKEQYSITRQNVNNKTGEHVLFHEIENDPDETDPDEKSAFEENKYSDNDPFETTSQETTTPFFVTQTTTTSKKIELITPIVFPDEVEDDVDDMPIKRTTRKDEAVIEYIDKNETSSVTSSSVVNDDYEDTGKMITSDATYVDPNQKQIKADEENNVGELYESPFTKLPEFEIDTDTDKNTDEDTADSSAISQDEYHIPREKVMEFDTRPSAVRKYLAKRISTSTHFPTTIKHFDNLFNRPTEEPTNEDRKPKSRPRLLYYQHRQNPERYLDLITGKDKYKKYYYDKDGVPRLKKPDHKMRPPLPPQIKYSKTLLRTQPDSIKPKYRYEIIPEKKVNQLAVLPKIKQQIKKKPITKTHKLAPTNLSIMKMTTKKRKPSNKGTFATSTTTKTPKDSMQTPKPKEKKLPAAVKVQPIIPMNKMENQTRIIPLEKATTTGSTIQVEYQATISDNKLDNDAHTSSTSKDILKIIPKPPKTHSIVETILNALLNKTKLLNETSINIAKTHKKTNETVEKKTVAVFKNLIKTILKVLADKSVKTTNKTWYNVTHPGASFFNKTGKPPDLDGGGRILPLSLLEPESNAASLFDKTFSRNSFKGNVSIVNITHLTVPVQTSYERDLHLPYIDDDTEETFENEPIFSEPETYNEIPKNLVETVLNIVLDKNLYLNDTSSKTYPYKDKNISKASPMYKSIVETVLNKYLNNKTQIGKLINTTQNLDLKLTSIEQDSIDNQTRLYANETSIGTRPYKKIVKEKIRIDTTLPTRQTTLPSQSKAISILNKYLASNATSTTFSQKETSKNTTPPAVLTEAKQISSTKTSFQTIDVNVTEPTKEELINKTSVFATTLKVLPITDRFIKGPPDVVNLSETDLSSTISSTDDSDVITFTKAIETTHNSLPKEEKTIKETPISIADSSKKISLKETSRKVKPISDTSLPVIDLNRKKPQTTYEVVFDTSVAPYKTSPESIVVDINKKLMIPHGSLNKTVDTTTVLKVLPIDENEPTEIVYKSTVPTHESLLDGTADTTIIPYTGCTEVSTLSNEINFSTSEVTIPSIEHAVLSTEVKFTEGSKEVFTTTESSPTKVAKKEKSYEKTISRITVNKTLKTVPIKATLDKNLKGNSEVKKKAEIILNRILTKPTAITAAKTITQVPLNKTISKKPKYEMHTTKTKLNKTLSFDNKTLPIYDTLLSNETWHQVPTHATMYLKKTLSPHVPLKKTTVKHKNNVDKKITGKEISYPNTVTVGYSPSTVATNEPITIKTIHNKTKLAAESYKNKEPILRVYMLLPTRKPKVQTVSDKKIHKIVDSKNKLTVHANKAAPSQQAKFLISKTKLKQNKVSKVETQIVTKVKKPLKTGNKTNEILTNKILKEAGTDRKSTLPLKGRGTQQSKETKVVITPITRTKPVVKTLPFISKFRPKITSTLTSVTNTTKASKKILTPVKGKINLATVNETATSTSIKKDSVIKALGRPNVNMKPVMEKIKQKTKLLPFTTLPTVTVLKKGVTAKKRLITKVGINRSSVLKIASKVTQKTTLPGLNIQQKFKSIHSTKVTKITSIKDVAKKQLNAAVAVRKVSKEPKAKPNTVASRILPTLKTTLPHLKMDIHTSLPTTTISRAKPFKSTSPCPSIMTNQNEQHKMEPEALTTKSTRTLPSVEQYTNVFMGKENTSKGPFRDDVHLDEDYDIYEDNTAVPVRTTPETIIDKILRINTTQWQAPDNETYEEEYYDDEEEVATTTGTNFPKRLYGSYIWSVSNGDKSSSTVTTTTSIPSVGRTDDLIQSTASYLTQNLYDYDKSLPPVPVNTTMPYTNTTSFEKFPFIYKTLATEPISPTSFMDEEKMPNIHVLPLIPPTKDDKTINVIGLSTIPDKSKTPTISYEVSRTSPLLSTVQPFSDTIPAKPSKPNVIPSTEKPTTTMSSTITSIVASKTSPKTSLATTTTEKKRFDKEITPSHPVKKEETTVPIQMTAGQDTDDKSKPSSKEILPKPILIYVKTPAKTVTSPTKETFTHSNTYIATIPTDSISNLNNVNKKINEVLYKTTSPTYAAEPTDKKFPMIQQYVTAPVSEISSTSESWPRRHEAIKTIINAGAPTSMNTPEVYIKRTLHTSTMASYDYEALAEIEELPSIEPFPETETYSTARTISMTISATTSMPAIVTKKVTSDESINKMELPSTNFMLDFEVDTPPISASTTSGTYAEVTFPSPDLSIDKPLLANVTVATKTLPIDSPTKETKFVPKAMNETIPMNITVIAIGSLPISNGTKSDNKKYAYTLLNDNLDSAVNKKISIQSPTEEYVRILANHTYPNITSFISKFNFNKTLLENYLYKLLSENETCVNKTNSVGDVHLNITLAIDRKHLNKTAFTEDALKRIGDKKNKYIKPYDIFNTPYEKDDDDKKIEDMNLKKLAIAIYLNRSIPTPNIYPVITPIPDFMDIVEDVDPEGSFYSYMTEQESDNDEVRPLMKATRPVLQPTLHIGNNPRTTKATDNEDINETTPTNIATSNEKAVTEKTDSYKEKMDRLFEGIDTKVVEKKSKATQSTTAQTDYTNPMTEFLSKNLTTLSDIYTKIAFPTIKSRTKPLSISETYWKHLLESEINKRKQVPMVHIYPTQSLNAYPKNKSQTNTDVREQLPIVQRYPTAKLEIFQKPEIEGPSTDRTLKKEESNPIKYNIPIQSITYAIPKQQKPGENAPQEPNTNIESPVFPKPETLRSDMPKSETYQPELPPPDLALYPETATTEAYTPDILTTKTYIEENESKFFIRTTTESQYARTKILPEKIRYEKSKRIHIDTCGIDNYPSSGGEEGTQRIEKYPWLGVLIYPRGKQRLVTTVVLVTVQLVVASALDIEKLPKKDLRTCARVVLGANCTGPRIKVVNYNYHPDFRAGTASAIALIQINTDFLDHQLRPICGPPKRFVDPQFFAMVMPNDCRSSKITLYAMDYVSTDKCKEYYKHAGLDVGKMWPKHTACGRASWGGQCTWRTGTLLVVRQEYRWHLVGFGVRGPGCEAPARFVDFAMYHQWVTTTVARIGQPAITRMGPNHLILRRSINQLQKFGPCDASEVSSEIFTDTTTLMPPDEIHQFGMARYNLTILANVDYHCVVFSAKNIRGMAHDPPRLELRRYCRGPPVFCFTGPGLIQIDFYVTIYFFYPIEYKVAAYGQLAKVVDPKLLTQYVNKRYDYPQIPFWQFGGEDQNTTSKNITSFKSRRTFLENYRNSYKYKYHKRMGRISRLQALEQRKLEILRRVAEEKRKLEKQEERQNNVTYIQTSREII